MTDLIAPLDAAAILRVIPTDSGEAQSRLNDFRLQTRDYVATILATIPPGQHRENALKFLRTSVTAAVMGIIAASSDKR